MTRNAVSTSTTMAQNTRSPSCWAVLPASCTEIGEEVVSRWPASNSVYAEMAVARAEMAAARLSAGCAAAARLSEAEAVSRSVSARFDLVTIDAPDTDRAATFWSEALDLVEVEREDVDRWIVLADRSGVRRIGIQRGAVRPGGVHLDLAVVPADFDSELERLVALGATLLDRRDEPYGSIANLRDAVGYVFDLCAYR